MELYEKDALKSWGFCYRPEQVTEWQHHYSGMFGQWKEQAFSYMPQDLEELLNVGYMETAQNPDTDMYRIWLCAGLDRDIRYGQTQNGPHRDDLDITLNGRSAAQFASEGQRMESLQ